MVVCVDGLSKVWFRSGERRDPVREKLSILDIECGPKVLF